ncbi:hypothetical protein H0H92_016114 [Tricholoma furcatifolium]|nr:hypothetical protein H0H92_016114 [Tricholoma furcatifolium]
MHWTPLDEKASTAPLLPSAYAPTLAHNDLKRRLLLSLSLIAYGTYMWLSSGGMASDISPALLPTENLALWDSLSSNYASDAFKLRAAEWIGGAVRIPTESYDDMGEVGEDPSHSTLTLLKVNTYGLLFTWPGSDASLKPLVLMGHQGRHVVPVHPETVKEWVHPPYSGHYDGESVWGRGSSDDKGGLISALSSVETLIESGFRPRRTLVLSFGFDEEISGLQGAANLATTLLDMYGKDGVAFIVDEGTGFSEIGGTIFATPGIAEKGYLDVRVEVTAPGGHSSVPPKHTSIGILAALLVEYEKNPYPVKLTRKDPLYSTLQCVAEHAETLPEEYRRLIKGASASEESLKALEQEIIKNAAYASSVGTTQAIDVIQGGIKANALPEKAFAIVNHRISVISSVAETQSHDTELLRGLAEKFNLTYTAFGKLISAEDAPSSGTLTLSDAYGDALNPAPVTPTSADAMPWKLLSGSIKATFSSHRSAKNKQDIIVSPGMSSGNTDTRFYWDLTPHIFRYNHIPESDGPSGVHTVNEHIKIDDFVEIIRFFTTLILNTDEAMDI